MSNASAQGGAVHGPIETSNDGGRLLSIVIPIFNEEAMIGVLADRLERLALELRPLETEFILVDDGSVDNSMKLLERLVESDSRYRAVSLSRNFGHQVAITAGLDYAQGDAVVFMDADMQDPPEVIPQMVEKWKEGFDVVSGKRIERRMDTFFKRVTAAAFYRTLRYVAQVEIPEHVGDFRLISRQAADALRMAPERHRFLRGLSAWIGFSQTSVSYERPEPAAGSTKYTPRKMSRLALDAFFSFSWFPLRIASLAGIVVMLASGLYVMVNIYFLLFTDLLIPGWTSIVGLVCLIGGMNLLLLGVMGE